MKGVTVKRLDRARFSSASDPRVYVQIDGEYAGRLPAEIRIVPDALRYWLQRSTGASHGNLCQNQRAISCSWLMRERIASVKQSASAAEAPASISAEWIAASSIAPRYCSSQATWAGGMLSLKPSLMAPSHANTTWPQSIPFTNPGVCSAKSAQRQLVAAPGRAPQRPMPEPNREGINHLVPQPEDTRIWAAIPYSTVFVVPVGKEHDQDLEPAQLPGPVEGRAVPSPVAVFDEFQMLVTELESRVREAAAGRDRGARPPERLPTLHLALSDEIARLRQITARPHDPPAEGFVFYLVAELHVPQGAGSVMHKEFRLGAAGVFPQKGERSARRRRRGWEGPRGLPEFRLREERSGEADGQNQPAA